MKSKITLIILVLLVLIGIVFVIETMSCIIQRVYYKFTKKRIFLMTPIHHTFECTLTYLFMTSVGGTIAICEGLKYVAQNMQEAHPTAMLAVPLLIESLYKKINEKIVNIL